MLLPLKVLIVAAITIFTADAIPDRDPSHRETRKQSRKKKTKCTSAMRLEYSSLIPKAYNMKKFGDSVAAFRLVPFAPPCLTQIYANGAPGVIVGVDDVSTRTFADETRQVFSKVTGKYTDFKNGTTIIHTNVTIGAAHYVPIPVTFSANVYLGFGVDCQIYTIDAYATIPSEVLGLVLNPPALPPGTIP